MIHKEFKLTVTEPIREESGRGVKPVHWSIGQELTLSEAEFSRLRGGEVVERFTNEGVLRFDKHHFANGVRVIEIEFTESEVKLGNTRGRKEVKLFFNSSI